MKIKYLNIFLTLTILVLIVGVFKAFFQFQDRSKILESAEKKHDEAYDQNEALKREYAKTQQPSFIEKEAREKLSLSREGEIVVILPPISQDLTPTPTPTPHLTNVQKWLKVFL